MSNLARTDAVLVLGGAFNPIHTQHVALLALVKEVVEAGHNYRVVAGHLAISTDKYVRGKLAHEAMKFVHRAATCNLATAGNDWIVPATQPFISASECGQALRPRDDVVILAVFGADRILRENPQTVRWRRKSRGVTVCVGRGDDSRRVLERYQADLRANLVPNPERFIFVEPEVGAVSSTTVRAELRSMHAATTAEEKRQVVCGLVERGLLHAAVGDYLLEHERDLYLD